MAEGGDGEKTHDEAELNGIFSIQELSSDKFAAETTTEEEADRCEEDSPGDYEYSLRIENIRLKSRLEQAKEQNVALERDKKRFQEEYEKEKEFAAKLVKEKQSMQEELKRRQNTLHHDDIQDVVAKLERDIYVLEDRLERQRKRYQQEHMMMYEDLKDERRKQQSWKYTYMKSQVAVLAFRRKLSNLKDRISPADKEELHRCLEIPIDKPEERFENDYLPKHDENFVADHPHPHSTKEKEELRAADVKRSPSRDTRNRHDARDRNSPYIVLSNSRDVDGGGHHGQSRLQTASIHNVRYKGDSKPTHESNIPKVFIMEDENSFIEATSKEPRSHYDPLQFASSEEARVHSPGHSPHQRPTDSKSAYIRDSTTRHESNGYRRYELDGNKHHHQSFSISYNYPNSSSSSSSSHEHRSTQYKHWHHYSVDNPAHSRNHENPTHGRGLENPIHGRTVDPTGALHNRHNTGKYRRIDGSGDRYERRNSPTLSSSFHTHGNHHNTTVGEHYNLNQSKMADNNDQLELNVNDTKFLELKFDNVLFKSDYKQPLVRPHEEKIHVPPGTPLETKKIWCLTCDGEVTKKPCGHANLVIQEREKEFPCPTCGRLFNNRSHLKRHNMIHSGEKPWACTYCDKRFNRKSHLNRHLLTHTGEKPFKCPYCSKGFADNSDLKRHKQVHETSPGFVPIRPKDTSSTPSGSSIPITIPTVLPMVSVAPKKKEERRFPCSKCGKVFTRKSHLTRHKLTHDLQKIYCDCGRMFRQNSHLQAHLPACKRRREAIEAKYKAEHENHYETVGRRDSEDSNSLPTMNGNSDLLSTQTENEDSYVTVKQEPDAALSENNAFLDPFQETKPSDLNFNNIDGDVVGLSNLVDDTFGVNFVSDIPPLIRDPS